MTDKGETYMEEKTKHKHDTEPVKSTTEDVAIYHADDEGDVLIVRIDAKHPARQKLFVALQQALEGAGRSEEAIKVKAYAQEKLPDDWRRKQGPKSGDQNTIRHPGEAQRPMVEPHATTHPAKTE